MILPLSELSPGRHGTVRKNAHHGTMRRRLIDLGLTENAPVRCVCRAPSGDPTAFFICGACIALRACDSCKITVEEGNG